MDGQTVCLDMLFTPKHMLSVVTPEWSLIHENKDRFLSKQCKGFLGYCRKQASIYGVKGERVAAVRNIVERLRVIVQNFGTQAKVAQFADTWYSLASENGFITLNDITLQNGVIVRHLSCCDRKVPFTSTIKEAYAIYARVLDEYGQRARAAETNNGVDWKAMSHAVRVGRQGLDLLQKGELIFPLPYADHLLKIETGQLDPKAVMEEIDSLLVEVEEAAEKSSLPDQPDRNYAESFVYHCYMEQVNGRR